MRRAVGKPKEQPIHRLPHEITRDQDVLLRAMATQYLAAGIWPTWDFLQDHLDGYDLDAETALRSLPRVGLNSRTYGYTSALTPGLNGPDRIRLTIAASVVVPEWQELVGVPFLRALHHMIKVYAETPRSPDEVTSPLLRSEDLQRAVPSLPPWVLRDFIDFVSFEVGLSVKGVSCAPDRSSWAVGITRSVRRFRGVNTVDDYVDTQCTATVEWARECLPAAPVPHLGEVLLSQAVGIRAEQSDCGPYVDAGLLADLEEVGKMTTWSLDKVCGLVYELNANFSARHPYACQALVRAIIDHIPPAFGQKGFAGVVSSHSWGSATDKAHAKRLSEYRSVGDDVMHRQIRNDPSLITMDDVPPRTQLNAVLRELLMVLRREAGA